MNSKQDETAELLHEDIRYVRAAEASPEQWDAFVGDVQVAHIRLCAGQLTVTCPDFNGNPLLSIRMDDEQGRFNNARQRTEHLRICHNIIAATQPLAPVSAASATALAP